ncbi:MAG: EAL domain-containing protein [Alicyclobacillus sp.]|nr:EAL domain-containing protein [Alicyclobacillus sp.]
MELPLLLELFDSLSDAMVLLSVEEDGNFRYQRANRYAYQKGLFSPERIGKRVLEAHPGPYAAYLQEQYTYAMRTKRPVIFKDVVPSEQGILVQEAIVVPVLNDVDTCVYLIAEVSHEVDSTTVQRVQATRRIFEAFFANEDHRVVQIRHGDKHLTVTDGKFREALRRQELFPEYQPLVNPQSGLVEGVEALVRWHHPDVGRIPPLAFVTAAEQLGFLIELDLWMMHHSCRQVAVASGNRCHVSVNISASHLKRRGFVDDVQTILADLGFPPDRLVLEITENALMEDVELAIEIMQALCATGVRFAIDDFGTGYSSLSYLKNLPVHFLKIDRSFIQAIPFDPRSAAIVETIALLGRRLGLCVVSEGVETMDQLQFAARHCDLVQGYIFSAPVRADQLRPVYAALSL